jgi:hypothetical protein
VSQGSENTVNTFPSQSFQRRRFVCEWLNNFQAGHSEDGYNTGPPSLASEKRAYLEYWLRDLPGDSGDFLPACEPPRRGRRCGKTRRHAPVWVRVKRRRLSLWLRTPTC